jgi:thiol-disulfide isomerase/thioredoxin
MISRKFLLTLATWSALVVLGPMAAATGWTVHGAETAAAALPARCATRATAAMRPNEAVYRICADQMALFTAALREAEAAEKLLIVDFGATWCPWCKSLQGQFKSGALADPAKFQVVEIALSTMSDGRLDDVPSGRAVLAAVLARRPEAKQRSVPFLAVIDPRRPDRTVVRNLDDLESVNAGQHMTARVAAFISTAATSIETGTAAPREPGWLAKKWTRLWNRMRGI